MNRFTVLEAMYEVIKDSTEWSFDSEDKVYGNYIDGVIAMTETMLEKGKEEQRIMSRLNTLEESIVKCEDVLERAKVYTDDSKLEIDALVTNVTEIDMPEYPRPTTFC